MTVKAFDGQRVMLAFHIGGQDSEYVRVAILGDHGDGWFAAQVEVVVGAFRGSYSADFNSWAFSRFRDDLNVLYRSVSGSASFTSYERQLELTLTGTARGHLRVRGEAMDYAGTGNRLTFELDIDQTYIPRIVSDLQAALERFPGTDFPS